ncbi:MAG: hypothetical protein IJD77_06300 [Clostridia bacterium]|nr:hypothetical protein [Clostridia bacterium]
MDRAFGDFGVWLLHKRVVDHTFDHLRIWTTWKQCEQEYRKASVADTKDLEMLGK